MPSSFSNRPRQAKLVEAATEISAEHGEGIFLDSRTQTIYWLDIDGSKLFALSEQGQIAQFSLSSRISKILPSENGDFVAWGQVIGVAKVSIGEGQVTAISQLGNPLVGLIDNFSNDAGVDPRGRLFFGSMSAAQLPSGKLFSLGSDRSIIEQLPSVSIANGIVWLEISGEYFLIFADSPTRQLRKYRYDIEQGRIKSAKDFDVIFEFATGEFPDGMCMDSKDNIYVAVWGGSRVVVFNPLEKKLIHEIHVPGALNVSSCAFAGKNFHTLYITTSKQGLSQADLAHYPNSGKLFSCELEIQGKRIPHCVI